MVVYSDSILTFHSFCFLQIHRKDGTKAVTRIKKVTGDQNVFLKELESTLQVPSNEVRIRTGGTIEINGNRVRDVKLWLAGLGF